MIGKSPLLDNLIAQLKKLPSIGKKSATRLAFHLIKNNKQDSINLAESIIAVTEGLTLCGTCYNITEQDPCSLCRSTERSADILCVVEQPEDVWIIEATGEFKGRYHVLMGVLSPLNGITPADLKIEELIHRVKTGAIPEILIATNPTLEGDSTALYIKEELTAAVPGTKVSRLAMGLPMGSNIEFSDSYSLSRAISNRKYL